MELTAPLSRPPSRSPDSPAGTGTRPSATRAMGGTPATRPPRTPRTPRPPRSPSGATERPRPPAISPGTSATSAAADARPPPTPIEERCPSPTVPPGPYPSSTPSADSGTAAPRPAMDFRSAATVASRSRPDRSGTARNADMTTSPTIGSDHNAIEQASYVRKCMRMRGMPSTAPVTCPAPRRHPAGASPAPRRHPARSLACHSSTPGRPRAHAPGFRAHMVPPLHI